MLLAAGSLAKAVWISSRNVRNMGTLLIVDFLRAKLTLLRHNILPYSGGFTSISEKDRLDR